MINRGWTLFLDRDGVINTRILGGYVQKWEQFEFLPGVPEALKMLSSEFSKIIIVSNQQGIGKGLMTEEELALLHRKMLDEIEQNGGRIDQIYYSPHLENERSVKRKPNVGMALMARKEFPGINFKRSVMVGDSISDMIFGKRLRMVNIFLSDDVSQARKSHECIDFVYPDLISFAEALSGMKNN
ncbi:MAG: HAD family hydrolase [Bacteroidetes bacterium]|nr:HAD family hydrolase [Bacteroidota bacterium]